MNEIPYMSDSVLEKVFESISKAKKEMTGKMED